MRWRKRAGNDRESDELIRSRSRERLEILSALVRAQERREEVLAVLASAGSDEQAQEELVSLLGLENPIQAMAILDMQLRRMTEANRSRIRAEYDELRAAPPDGG